MLEKVKIKKEKEKRENFERLLKGSRGIAAVFLIFGVPEQELRAAFFGYF